MRNVDKMKPMRGVLTIQVVNSKGEIIREDVDNNLIVNGGLKAGARCFGGDPDYLIKKVQIGTDNTTPNVNDTSITNSDVVNIDSVSYPADNEVEFAFTFDQSIANGKTIVEYGLFTENDTLVARKIREGIYKNSDLTLQGTWKIIF